MRTGIDCKGRKWEECILGRAKDLSQTKYGRLLPLFRVKGDFVYNTGAFWLCKCDCGNYIVEPATELNYGKIRSCGCFKKEYLSLTKSEKLEGQRFNKLLVIEAAGSNNSQKRLWKCLCDCGNTVYANTGDLKNGHIQSCGCLHGKSLGEQRIEQILKENHIKYIHNKNYFKDLILPNNGIGRYDFILIDENNKPYRLIEFDGIQHYKPTAFYYGHTPQINFDYVLQNDKTKNEYAFRHNLPLVRIPYYVINKININMLLYDDTFLIKTTPTQE